MAQQNPFWFRSIRKPMASIAPMKPRAPAQAQKTPTVPQGKASDGSVARQNAALAPLQARFKNLPKAAPLGEAMRSADMNIQGASNSIRRGVGAVVNPFIPDIKVTNLRGETKSVKDAARFAADIIFPQSTADVALMVAPVGRIMKAGKGVIGVAEKSAAKLTPEAFKVSRVATGAMERNAMRAGEAVAREASTVGKPVIAAEAQLAEKRAISAARTSTLYNGGKVELETALGNGRSGFKRAVTAMGSLAEEAGKHKGLIITAGAVGAGVLAVNKVANASGKAIEQGGLDLGWLHLGTKTRVTSNPDGTFTAETTGNDDAIQALLSGLQGDGSGNVGGLGGSWGAGAAPTQQQEQGGLFSTGEVDFGQKGANLLPLALFGGALLLLGKKGKGKSGAKKIGVK